MLAHKQVDVVQTRARAVPPRRWRQRARRGTRRAAALDRVPGREKFLRAVADQLALIRSPTNKDILAKCGSLQYEERAFDRSSH
jgi:hypothetical protein